MGAWLHNCTTATFRNSGLGLQYYWPSEAMLLESKIFSRSDMFALQLYFKNPLKAFKPKYLMEAPFMTKAGTCSLSIYVSEIGKTYERASNACVNFFLPWVKSVPSFTLFCCKNELYRNFALCRVILMGFTMVKF